MMTIRSSFIVPTSTLGGALLLSLITLGAADRQQPPPTPQQRQEGSGIITSGSGSNPKLAVPDFIAATPDAETKAIATTIGEVLWNDLKFEREFYMIPRDTYQSIPPAPSLEAIPFDRWRELGADGLVIGSVRKNGTAVTVEVRLFNVAARNAAFAKEYSGTAANPRLFAHTISDEIHKLQRNLIGVARTKLTFSSDRDGERIKGTVYDLSLIHI